jgi:hypothetical protein
VSVDFSDVNTASHRRLGGVSFADVLVSGGGTGLDRSNAVGTRSSVVVQAALWSVERSSDGGDVQ